jgi:hypothetical protein
MGIGVSLLLIAVGAILTRAVDAEASGVDLQTTATRERTPSIIPAACCP